MRHGDDGQSRAPQHDWRSPSRGETSVQYCRGRRANARSNPKSDCLCSRTFLKYRSLAIAIVHRLVEGVNFAPVSRLARPQDLGETFGWQPRQAECAMTSASDPKLARELRLAGFVTSGECSFLKQGFFRAR